MVRPLFQPGSASVLRPLLLAAAVLSPCVVGGVPVAAQEAAEDGADGAGDAGRPVADAGSAAWTKAHTGCAWSGRLVVTTRCTCC